MKKLIIMTGLLALWGCSNEEPYDDRAYYEGLQEGINFVETFEGEIDGRMVEISVNNTNRWILVDGYLFDMERELPEGVAAEDVFMPSITPCGYFGEALEGCVDVETLISDYREAAYLEGLEQRFADTNLTMSHVEQNFQSQHWTMDANVTDISDDFLIDLLRYVDLNSSDSLGNPWITISLDNRNEIFVMPLDNVIYGFFYRTQDTEGVDTSRADWWNLAHGTLDTRLSAGRISWESFVEENFGWIIRDTESPFQ